MPALGNESGRSNPQRIAAPYSARRPSLRSLRSASVVVFVVSMILSACGRQITSPAAGTSADTTTPAGWMSLRFRVKGPLDFTNVEYVIVFNTSGNGAQPYANALTSGFQNYSVPSAGTGLQTQPVVVLPQNVQLLIGTSGTPDEFTLRFARISFNVPNPAATGASSPSSTPTATSGPSPTASAASPTPTASGATPAPSLLPTTPAQVNWNVNFFTVNANPANG